MFSLNLSPVFIKKSEKLVKKDRRLEKIIIKAVRNLEENPNNPILKSHKITRKNGERAFSSRVTADIRIIWDYQNGQACILDILDIGGHSGKNKVYKK